MPVEVLVVTHLGPGRIESERDYHQQDIDDPDAEVLRPLPGETHLCEAPGCSQLLRRSAAQLAGGKHPWSLRLRRRLGLLGLGFNLDPQPGRQQTLLVTLCLSSAQTALDGHRAALQQPFSLWLTQPQTGQIAAQLLIRYPRYTVTPVQHPAMLSLHSIFL